MDKTHTLNGKRCVFEFYSMDKDFVFGAKDGAYLYPAFWILCDEQRSCICCK